MYCVWPFRPMGDLRDAACARRAEAVIGLAAPARRGQMAAEPHMTTARARLVATANDGLMAGGVSTPTDIERLLTLRTSRTMPCRTGLPGPQASSVQAAGLGWSSSPGRLCVGPPWQGPELPRHGLWHVGRCGSRVDDESAFLGRGRILQGKANGFKNCHDRPAPVDRRG